jgi:hypothetical protein
MLCCGCVIADLVFTVPPVLDSFLLAIVLSIATPFCTSSPPSLPIFLFLPGHWLYCRGPRQLLPSPYHPHCLHSVVMTTMSSSVVWPLAFPVPSFGIGVASQFSLFLWTRKYIHVSQIPRELCHFYQYTILTLQIDLLCRWRTSSSVSYAIVVDFLARSTRTSVTRLLCLRFANDLDWRVLLQSPTANIIHHQPPTIQLSLALQGPRLQIYLKSQPVSKHA